MLLRKPCSFVQQFIEELDSSLSQLDRSARLSISQKYWLSFCVMGILLTNSVCWARFERASLGHYSMAALSWMFRCSKISWDLLLQASVSLILQQYHITEGILVIDDTDKKRSKVTTNIFNTYKVHDKATSGYFNGQTLVFLLLVTDKVTFPVAFQFYRPDPDYSAWAKEDKLLRKQGVSPKLRPKPPEKNSLYPKKTEIAYSLLEQFKLEHPQIKVKLILADNLYCLDWFMDKAMELFEAQVISQVRANQLVQFRGKKMSVEEYFKRKPIEVLFKRRGEKEINIGYDSARLFLEAHKKKRFLVALKYEGESEYRYLVGSDLSWRGLDLVEGYSFRWLVEVFFEDWKQYEGWGQLTKQTGIDGSSRGLILSLLLDHCLLLHPQQKARLKDKLPAATVGSLLEKIKIENLLENIREFVQQKNSIENLENLTNSVKEVFHLRDSTKHMIGRDFQNLKPTPSLKHHARITFAKL